MRITISRSLGALLLGLVGTAVLGAPASAHERREVGDILMVVGFGTEPAFAGYPNSVDLALSLVRSERPIVEGVDLQVEVSFGEASTSMPLEPAFVVGVFGEPGSYGADFIPSRPGPYTFRFTGTVGEREIDETFTSGPETFSEASDPAEVAFPAQDPSNAELADRIETESAALRSAAANAEDAAASARTLAIVALVVGAAGLAIGATLGLRGRKAG